MRDWRQAQLEPVDRALCAFAEKLSLAPTTRSAEDLEPLRREGLDDRAIHDAVQVIAYFNSINRIADGLGTDLEDWMGRQPPWQR